MAQTHEEPGELQRKGELDLEPQIENKQTRLGDPFQCWPAPRLSDGPIAAGITPIHFFM